MLKKVLCTFKLNTYYHVSVPSTQNFQNLVHNFYQSHFEILPNEFSPKSKNYFDHHISSPFIGDWHRPEN